MQSSALDRPVRLLQRPGKQKPAVVGFTIAKEGRAYSPVSLDQWPCATGVQPESVLSPVAELHLPALHLFGQLPLLRELPLFDQPATSPGVLLHLPALHAADVPAIAVARGEMYGSPFGQDINCEAQFG